MQDNEILIEHGGAIVTLTFNRPDRLNAFRRATYKRLETILLDLKKDDAVRIVVMTGRGRGFCAGEDLKELEAARSRGAAQESLTSGIATMQNITRTIAASDQIFIAAVNGVAAGFGAELAVACDIRVVSESARFLFPEVARGLFITNGISWLLPRLVGQSRATHLLLSGETIDARAALNMGLVTHLTPDSECLSTAQNLARSLAAHAELSLRLVKRVLRESASGTLEEALERETRYAIQCFEAASAAEGTRAFLDKRAPAFKGDTP